MSLEESVKELALSVRDLAAALNKSHPAPSEEVITPGKGALKQIAEKALGQTIPVISPEIEQAQPEPKPKKAKAPKAEEPAPEAKPALPKPTLQELRDAAQAALDAGKLDQVVALNKELGVKRISEAPEEKWAEAIARLKGAVANG